MVQWFRRRKNGDPRGETDETSREAVSTADPGGGTLQDSVPLEVETEKAADLVDRTSKPEEPADGFSEAGVREALRDVRDPEIGRDLVSLNLVRSIDIVCSYVTVGIVLSTAGCLM